MISFRLPIGWAESPPPPAAFEMEGVLLAERGWWPVDSAGSNAVGIAFAGSIALMASEAGPLVRYRRGFTGGRWGVGTRSDLFCILLVM